MSRKHKSGRAFAFCDEQRVVIMDAKTFLSSILLSNGKIVIKRNGETFIVNPFDYNEKRFSEE